MGQRFRNVQEFSALKRGGLSYLPCLRGAIQVAPSCHPLTSPWSFVGAREGERNKAVPPPPHAYPQHLARLELQDPHKLDQSESNTEISPLLSQPALRRHSQTRFHKSQLTTGYHKEDSSLRFKRSGLFSRKLVHLNQLEYKTGGLHHPIENQYFLVTL